MTSSREPDSDLNLEALGSRSGRRPTPLDEKALIRQLPGEQSFQQKDFRTAYEALIDAVFTAPGAVEWLAGLRRVVAAMLGSKTEVDAPTVQTDAIRTAETGEERS